MILINGIEIVKFINTLPICVGHADFLPLENKWQTAKQQTHSAEHFGAAGITGINRKISRSTPGLVMILDNIGFETTAISLILGMKNSFFPCRESNVRGIIPTVFTGGEEFRTEVENSRKITIFSDKIRQIIISNIKNFTHSKSTMLIKGFTF